VDTAVTAPRGRTLHIVDVDNLTVGPTEFQCVAEAAALHYRRAAKSRRGDLFVVGCDTRAVAVTILAWRGARVVHGTGPDIVDAMLIDELAAHTPGDFVRVVVGSGDYAFAPIAEWLQRSGTTVEVVSRRGAIANSLAAACHVVRHTIAVGSLYA
jgi:hypothetical protein